MFVVVEDGCRERILDGVGGKIFLQREMDFERKAEKLLWGTAIKYVSMLF